MSDATASFKNQLRESFEAMQVGQTFTFRRTFTDGDLSLFCGVTGDYNPYHIDDAFVEESWFERRSIPGLLTGSMITQIGGMIGFLVTDMTFQFLLPVYVGDTITCEVIVRHKDEAKRRINAEATFVNQRGAKVLKASFSGFPAQIRLAR